MNSLNDLAWEKLFIKHKIIESVTSKGFFEINANEIKVFREPRLMTKFDHKEQLPDIFAKNKFSILPIRRGSYVISDIETFFSFNKDKTSITEIPFPNHIQSIDYNQITSEALALNCAFITGMIQDFTGDNGLMPTLSGRMSSKNFDFKINRTNKKLLKIHVENSQLEIDGGYEGDEFLTLIEAKNVIAPDFMIRQLYYPFRLWSDKISKKIKNVFLTYSNGIFHFREYEFIDSKFYNSIQLVRSKKYSIQDTVINLDLIQAILDRVTIIEEPKIPFPQADSFERVINTCELLYKSELLSKNKITNEYQFDSRQTNYYTSAGMYLGLIVRKYDNKEVTYSLTPKGQTLFQIPLSERQVKFIELILSHSVFNKTLKLYFKKLEMPKNLEIIEIMKCSNLYNINSEDTFKRRASTIRGWLNWILEQNQDY